MESPVAIAEEHHELRGHQIEIAVVVEVRGRHVEIGAAGIQLRGAAEGSIAVAEIDVDGRIDEEKREVLAAWVDRYVQSAVVIEVPRGERRREVVTEARLRERGVGPKGNRGDGGEAKRHRERPRRPRNPTRNGDIRMELRDHALPRAALPGLENGRIRPTSVDREER